MIFLNRQFSICLFSVTLTLIFIGCDFTEDWPEITRLQEVVNLPEDGWEAWDFEASSNVPLRFVYEHLDGISCEIKVMDEKDFNAVVAAYRDGQSANYSYYESMSAVPLSTKVDTGWVFPKSQKYYIVAENRDDGLVAPPTDGVDNPSRFKITVLSRKKPE